MIFLLFFSCETEHPLETQETGVLDCDNAPTYTDWASGFFRGKCQACHASTTIDRHEAPENITFDNYEQIKAWLPSIELSVLENNTMPPSGGVTDEEEILLSQWLDCPY